jgi:hypothetical protein
MGIVVVMMMMMMVMAIVLRSAHHALDAADDATCHATDHAANRRANRTGGAPAFGRASLATPDYSLSTGGERHRKGDKKDKKARSYGQKVFHG